MGHPDKLLRAVEGGERRPERDVRNGDGSALARREHEHGRWIELDREDPAVQVVRLALQLTGAGIPDLLGTIASSGHDERAIGRERDLVDRLAEVA